MTDSFVIANGEKIRAGLPCTIQEFLLAQHLLPRSVVVEHNGEAVAPSEFAGRMLAAGDRLEIVKIVAGGMNPDLAAFLNSFGAEVVFGQVLIERKTKGFELRHVNNRAVAAESLEVLTAGKLRALAQFTAQGAFRPLKSTPDLREGWRANVPSPDKLSLALGGLYPGAVADWFAAQSTPPPITSYRQFTARQSGIYRVTTQLDDAQAGAAILECCARCLKRRLWSVEGLEPDGPEQKSLIPCLEPCAVMLDFARKVAARNDLARQADKPLAE